MLTRAPIGASTDLDSSLAQRVAAAITAAGAAAVLVASVVESFHGERIRLSDDRVAGSTKATGEAVFQSWVLPFELLSLLLLAALIGAIVLSRRDIAPGPPRATSRTGH
jgi:NADH-quinone oxidoreductase subunit J